MSTGTKARTDPAALLIELTNQGQQTVAGGVDIDGKFRGLVFTRSFHGIFPVLYCPNVLNIGNVGRGWLAPPAQTAILIFGGIHA